MISILIGSACLLGSVVCLAVTGLIVMAAVEYVNAYKKDQK
ncbi:hypothetical protein [Faecalispora anaeroviscerum]|nr:hypothetical protein [Faecalispora anaeroviscerum]